MRLEEQEHSNMRRERVYRHRSLSTRLGPDREANRALRSRL